MPAEKKATEQEQNSWNGSGQTNTEKATNNNDQMIQLGGLWINESKSGNKYMSGYLGNAKLMIFKNNFKSEDKHPDYVMYIASNKPKNNDDDGFLEEDGDDMPF